MPTPSCTPSPQAEEDLDADEANPPFGSPSWAYDMGVVRAADGGDAASALTTICFSRRLYDERAKGSASTNLTARKRRVVELAASDPPPPVLAGRYVMARLVP